MASVLNQFGPVVVQNEAAAVIDPTGSRTALRSLSDRAGAASRTLARRPVSLEGAVLAVIDNKAGNRQLTEPLVAALRKRIAFAEVIRIEKDTVNVPPRAKDWAEVAARATAGITLFGA
jgi:hypothetical protein